jgi:hypothetical protein
LGGSPVDGIGWELADAGRWKGRIAFGAGDMVDGNTVANLVRIRFAIARKRIVQFYSRRSAKQGSFIESVTCVGNCGRDKRMGEREISSIVAPE